jgi:hypothetical protein
MTVTPIPVPAEIIRRAGLEPVHYREAFSFPAEVARTPEEWVRRTLEEAPPARRETMLRAWRALGVQLAKPGFDRQVLGWPILEAGPEAIVLGVRARIGLTARLVVTVAPGRVVHAMLVRYDRRIARPLWSMVAPKHAVFIVGLLKRASA